MGHHCEIYSNIAEFVSVLPTEGIVLVRDEENGEPVRMVRNLADRGAWLPVVATSADPRPGRVVEAIKNGAFDYLRLPLREDRLQKAVVQILEEAQSYILARRKITEAGHPQQPWFCWCVKADWSSGAQHGGLTG